MKKMDFKSRWVLVTGASSGLGREIALRLAKKERANLVLTARRVDRLRGLKKELEGNFGIRVAVVPADLSNEQEVESLFDRVVAGRDIYGVVLNAGVAHMTLHWELSREDFDAMLQTNLLSTVRLTDRFLPYLIDKGQQGGIMFVTSLAGLIPIPYQTAYSATKAFVTTFGRALHSELVDQGIPVSVTSFVPGGIATEMNELTGTEKYFGKDNLQLQSPERCALEAVKAFKARKYLAVSGRLNRMQFRLSSLLSRRFLGSKIAAVYRKAVERK